MDTTRDRAWLERLYRAHRGQVAAYAARRVHADEVDDVVAEVFATAWRQRATVPGDALPWLYRTAGNHVLHARRGAARRDRLTHRIGATDTVRPFEDLDAALDAEDAVHAMLAQLPDADAEILRLTAWEDLDTARLAAVLGCSVTAVRVRLHRARRRAESVLARLDSQAGPPRAPRAAAAGTPRAHVATTGARRLLDTSSPQGGSR